MASPIVGRTSWNGPNMNTQVSGGPDLIGMFMEMMQRQQAAAPVKAASPAPRAAFTRAAPPSSSGGSGGHGGVGHSAAPAIKKGKPVFTKTVGGPGMQGGTIRLNQWEPGAAFAGYEEDLGSGPAGANMEAPGVSAASAMTSPPNVAPAGAYTPGIPTMGAVPGNPGVQGGSTGLAPTVDPGVAFRQRLMEAARANSDAEFAARQAQSRQRGF